MKIARAVQNKILSLIYTIKTKVLNISNCLDRLFSWWVKLIIVCLITLVELDNCFIYRALIFVLIQPHNPLYIIWIVKRSAVGIVISTKCNFKSTFCHVDFEIFFKFVFQQCLPNLGILKVN